MPKCPFKHIVAYASLLLSFMCWGCAELAAPADLPPDARTACPRINPCWDSSESLLCIKQSSGKITTSLDFKYEIEQSEGKSCQMPLCDDANFMPYCAKPITPKEVCSCLGIADNSIKQPITISGTASGEPSEDVWQACPISSALQCSQQIDKDPSD